MSVRWETDGAFCYADAPGTLSVAVVHSREIDDHVVWITRRDGLRLHRVRCCGMTLAHARTRAEEEMQLMGWRTT